MNDNDTATTSETIASASAAPAATLAAPATPEGTETASPAAQRAKQIINDTFRADCAPKPKARRGFACLSPERQREIAAKGGRASHAKGTGHRWTKEEAAAAGKRGGEVSRGGRGKL